MYREQYGEYADWFWVRKGWCVWNSLTMGSEVQRISETTVWTKLIKIFYRNNCSSSISFIQKSLFFPPIVCVVFFFHQKKNSQWLKIRNLSPTKGIANEDDPQIQKQEQPANSQQEPAVKLCWPKTMKESSLFYKQSLLHYDTNLSWLVIKQLEPPD